MCAAVGRGIRTPDMVVGKFNLHKEVLMWVYFTIVNQNQLKTFLPPQETRDKWTITNRLLKILWILSLIRKIMPRKNTCY